MHNNNNYDQFSQNNITPAMNTMKWRKKQLGKGFFSGAFTIQPDGTNGFSDSWTLRFNGQFIAMFKTAGSCKRVAQCINRELSVTIETLILN